MSCGVVVSEDVVEAFADDFTLVGDYDSTKATC
jgi:hypothetical protein